MLRGMMMDRPLLVSSLIEYAALYHGDTEVVSRTVEGGIHRYGWADAERRAKRLAKALQKLGVKLGDRVATTSPRPTPRAARAIASRRLSSATSANVRCTSTPSS